MVRELNLRGAPRAVLEREAVDRAVHVAGQDGVAVGGGAEGGDVCIRAVQLLALVVPQDAHFHSPVCEPEDELVGLLERPRDAGHPGIGLQELVADALLLAPLEPELVDEDNIVRLRDRQLGAVGREGHARHDVVLGALGVGRLGAELVLLVPQLVKEVHHPVCCGGSEPAVVGRPCQRCHPRDPVAGRLQRLQVPQLHPSHAQAAAPETPEI
mmetsp:Transcript_11352/g.27842  ORF Transcript_11352/g.27842 Transcript_11352/m.27842 type:complete len:213 (-) Transcript_11352:175-813(-)